MTNNKLCNEITVLQCFLLSAKVTTRSGKKHTILQTTGTSFRITIQELKTQEKAILIIRNLYQNQIQKVSSRKTFRKRYTGKHALDCIANHKCTMKLYPLDMLLAVGGSDNLIGQRTYPRAPEEELSTNSSRTS